MRPGLLPPGASAPRGVGDDSAAPVAGLITLGVIGLFVGSTVASYYLVKGLAPRKSGKGYGAAAAASNLFFPIVGPVVVGVLASQAPGKR